MGRALALLPLVAVALSCDVDTIPVGVRATPPGSGPTVVFDPQRRPLPEIPLPNDFATFADPTSRTGLRIDASLVSTSAMEQRAREAFDDLEGWGTYAPVTVTFARAPGQDARTPAIDLDDVHSRIGRDYEFADDPVYLIDLDTGVPAVLDAGKGNFPLALATLGKYWEADPRAAEQNLVYESVEEGAGLSQADYRPELDTDFDGVLDHPNTLGPPGQWPGLDDLLSWYERETDTLVLRPVVPLEEMHHYAVVLTDRLRGPGGQPVRSPFPHVHHPAQRAAAERVRDILSDRARANYYGDIAGTGLDHVAFTWTFTTQPVFDDMRRLRDGLYGRGPFAYLHDRFPAKATLFRAVGLAEDEGDEPASWQSDPRCTPMVKLPYTAKLDSIRPFVKTFLPLLSGIPPSPRADALVSSLDAVDHIVVGTFSSPFLLGDPASTDPDTRFHVNFQTGEGNVRGDDVHFWLAVPKATDTSKQPFPVAFWQHGVTGHDAEVLQLAGWFARQGLATFGFDAPEHGMAMGIGLRLVTKGLLTDVCLTPWITGVASGRAHDLDGDGTLDSGGLWWTSHIAHTRDNVRQMMLDALQAVRTMRSFDGTTLADQDFDGDGTPDLAGDFDADGTPDVGGPDAKYFASGESLGGLWAELQGGIDPWIVASAPVSGGGGGADLAVRSYGVPDPVMLQVMSPLVIAVPASERSDVTKCTSSQKTVRFLVNNLTVSREVEIACLDPSEASAGMTVVVRNGNSGEKRCARTTSDGRFRVAFPASIGDRVSIDVFGAPDAVDSYGSCNALPDAPLARHIDTWEQPTADSTPVADPNDTCNSDAGCAQFRGTFYPVGSPLVAPQEGLGLMRQTPNLRRFMSLAQVAFEGADPIDFAPYYMMRPLPGVDGAPVPAHALLGIDTVGDGYVCIATGNAFARAAGALPFLPPDFADRFPECADYAAPEALRSAWGATPNDVLVRMHVLEGVARLARAPAGPQCGANWAPSAACGGAPALAPDQCADSLYDSDWLSEGRQRFDQQHLDPPMRLARFAGVHATDSASLARVWTPRIAGAPFSADARDAASAPLLAVVNAYFAPLGQHVWDAGPNPCLAWDDALYMDNLIARFFATGGADLYYLSHPSTHECLADSSCPFFR